MNIIKDLEDILKDAGEAYEYTNDLKVVPASYLQLLIEEYKNSQEPFGYFKSEPFGWTDCSETDEGAIALYENPPLSNETLKDAERYRWLRYGDNDELVIQHSPVAPDYNWLPRNERLDEMIDAAIDEAMKTDNA